MYDQKHIKIHFKKQFKILSGVNILWVGDVILLDYQEFNFSEKKKKYVSRIIWLKGLIISWNNAYIASNIKILVKKNNIFYVKTFFLWDSSIQKISRLKSFKVRRAKLFFLEWYLWSIYDVQKNKKIILKKKDLKMLSF